MVVRETTPAGDAVARTLLQRRFADAGTLVLGLVSAPGSGKTALLEATAYQFAGQRRLGAVVGDVCTDLDAERLRDAGLSAVSVQTRGANRLDANMVLEAVDSARFGPLDVLFVEHVGDLLGPSDCTVGEDRRVILLSVVEGPDKPFKFARAFAGAAATVITKADLLSQVAFDLGAVRQQVRRLNPQADFLVTSVCTGAGLDAWVRWISHELVRKRARHVGAGR